uniref:Uncharacterized protein n=1 Tax=Romanomermis culicivorax TaxID=13658 RepID=A0A915KZB7_ROMCU
MWLHSARNLLLGEKTPAPAPNSELSVVTVVITEASLECAGQSYGAVVPYVAVQCRMAHIIAVKLRFSIIVSNSHSYHWIKCCRLLSRAIRAHAEQKW